MPSPQTSVPSNPENNRHFRHFFWTPAEKILKIGTCKFGRNFLHWRKFHNTKFCYVLKDVEDAISRFKPFPGHSMDIQQWAVKKSADAVGKFSACKFIKRFWEHFLDLCIQKRRNLLWSSDAFCKFSPCKLCEKFWAHTIDFCVQKWSCFLFTSIRKFSLYEVYEKSFGRIFTIYASRNVAVFREVQTQFGTSPPASYAEKVLDAFSRFMLQKRSCFPWSSDAC